MTISRKLIFLFSAIVLLAAVSLSVETPAPGAGNRQTPPGARFRGRQPGFYRPAPPMQPNAGNPQGNVPSGQGYAPVWNRFQQPGMGMQGGTKPKIDRTIVISIDSMNNTYIFDRWRNPGMALTPNIRELVRNGAAYQNAEATLPALTQTNNISIVSGCYPDRIGFAGNEVYNKNKKGYIKFDFPWKDNKLIKCDTLPLAIKRAKPESKTAVIAGKDYVGCAIQADYTIAPACESKGMRKEFPKIRRFPEVGGWDAPDVWVMDNALQVLEKADPAFMFVHLGFVDPVQHNFGQGSPQAWAAVEWADNQVGRLLKSLRESGRMATTLVVLTADHGQSNYWRRISIRKMLEEKGIAVEFIQAGQLSHIFLKDKSKALETANFLRTTGMFDGVWTGAELDVEHLRTPYTGDVVVSVSAPYDAIEFKGPFGIGIHTNMYGNHGGIGDRYVPLIFFGPGVRRGVMLGGPGRMPGFGRFYRTSRMEASLADIVPTICSLTGLPLPKDVQGKVLPIADLSGRPAYEIQPVVSEEKAGGRSLAQALFFILALAALLGVRRASPKDKAPGITQGILAVIALAIATNACLFGIFLDLYNSVPGIRPDAYLVARLPMIWGTPIISHTLLQIVVWTKVWIVYGALFAILAKILAKEKASANWIAFPTFLTPLATALLLLSAWSFFFDIAYWRVRPILFIVYAIGLAASAYKMAKSTTGDTPAPKGRTAAAVATVVIALVVAKIIFSLGVGMFVLSQLTYFPLGLH